MFAIYIILLVAFLAAGILLASCALTALNLGQAREAELIERLTELLEAEQTKHPVNLSMAIYRARRTLAKHKAE
jgi:hypothetical protein